jgi:quercetin dioxygenase-like cupin family protein
VSLGEAGDCRPPQSADRAFLAHETATPWEYDPPDASEPTAIRWRTLVSAGRTPSSGLAMGVMEVPPGAALAPHRHDPPEVYHVVAGEGEVYLDGGWRAARAGDVAYLPGGHVHGARNRGSSEFRVIWVFPVDDYEDVVYVDVEPERPPAT